MEQIKAVEVSRKLRKRGSKIFNSLPWDEYLAELDKATVKYKDLIERNNILQRTK